MCSLSLSLLLCAADIEITKLYTHVDSSHADSLIDETIKSLADELRYCLDLKKQLREKASVGAMANNASTKNDDMMAVDVKLERGGAQDTEEKSSAIVSKFSKWQTDILTDWMIQNREHPFPSQAEIQSLAEATKLKNAQVVNWTTNVRKRNLKATVEGSKKPHHFLGKLIFDQIFL